MPDSGRKKVSGKSVEQDTSQEEFKVEDRRHWQAGEDDTNGDPDQAQVDDEGSDDTRVEPQKPTLLEEFRLRAETAEAKLQQYIDAYKSDREEQERFRVRLERDVDRRVGLQFGELVAELLMSMDDLDLALTHVAGNPETGPLAKGVTMARDRFLTTLLKHGIEKIAPDGQEFDPNEAEALRMDPVDTAEANGKVTETLQPGYRLGERVIRPARVAVGRHSP